MDASARLATYIKAHPDAVGKVVDFNGVTDCLYKFDFTAANTELRPYIIADSGKFSRWVNAKLTTHGCRYGIGGYMEHRTIYAHTPLFNAADEPRRLHLGIDIWAEAGTPVYSPLEGKVHSFQDNAGPGDYGPTIILQHDLDGLTLYSLYGHLSRQSLDGLSAGQEVSKDQQIGGLGNSTENGHWPPHLHFQLMLNVDGNFGDYPGVGRFSQKEKFLQNIPDPNLILGFPED